MEPTATDWAYLAGLIDGEGSLYLSHRHDGYANSYHCVVFMVNTDIKMIDWIVDTFGGCRRQDMKDRRANRKPYYRLVWADKQVLAWILKGILPYLTTKYDVAEAMLHFLTIPRWEKEMRLIANEEFQNLKEEVKNRG